MTDNGYLLNEQDAADFSGMREEFLRGDVDAGGAQQPAHVWQPDRLTSLKVQLTSTIAQGGRYKGKRIGLGVNTAPTGNLANTDFGDVPSSEGVIFWNAAEIGSSTHALAVDGSCVVVGVIVGFSTDAGTLGWPIVVSYVGGSGGSTIILAMITAVSAGTFEANSGAWTYTGDIVGGATDVTLRNKCEVTAGDVGANTRYGNGVWIVKTTGQVVGSDCFIIPLGVGIIVHCWPDPDNEGDYAFSLPNSAEIPIYAP